jgi:hypothetical protein
MVSSAFCAQSKPTPAETQQTAFKLQARKVFDAALARKEANSDDPEANWQFGRACFDLAEFATNRTERALLADHGILASLHAISLQSNSAPAHYYLGMNLGQLARTKSLGALKLVNQMEREFLRARELDEKFDQAGPDRSLGMLYLEAPTIGSVGSHSKAKQHLRRAAELAPKFPENRLNLLEAYLKWGDRPDARVQLKALDELWPAAKASLTGEAWAPSWVDWEKRLQKARKYLQDLPKAVESPHQKN